MASAHSSHMIEEAIISSRPGMEVTHQASVLPLSPRISMLNSVSPPLAASRELQRSMERPLQNFLVKSTTRPQAGLKAIGEAVQWQMMPVGSFQAHLSSPRPNFEHVEDYSSYTLLACDHCEPCSQCHAPVTETSLSGGVSSSCSTSHRKPPPTVLQRLRKLPRKALQLILGTDLVVDPRTTPMQLFDALVWALAVVYGALVPFEVAFYDFDHYSSWRFLWFERFSDLVFMLDMVLQFFTMYFCFATMRYIRRPEAIASRYLHSLFVFDVFANIPIDLIHVVASIAAQLARGSISIRNSIGAAVFSEEVTLRTMFGFRLLRLTRITRLRTLYMSFRVRFGITSAQTQVPQFLVMCGYAAHTLACIWGMTGRYGKSLGASKTWVQAVNEEKGDDVAINHPFRLYSRCIYWSVATVTGNGYGDIVPVNDLEYVVVTIGMMVAGFVWAYAIGTICGIVAALDQQRMNFEFRMDRLEVMMKEQDLDVQLKRQLRRYCRHQAESVQMRQDLNLLRMMSPGLHARIAKHQIGRWLEQVPYMQEIAASNQVIMYIRSEVCSFVCNPREAIELPQALCQLRRGLILKACRIYCRGTIWGHHDVLLSNIDHLDKETPVALTFSEVLYLPKRAIDMLEDYPKARTRIRRARARSACLRYFLKRGRDEINARKGRTLVKNRYYKDAVSAAAQEESTQSKLQSLQRKFEDLTQQLDEAIDLLKDTEGFSESPPKASEHQTSRKPIRDAFAKTIAKSRDSLMTRYAFWNVGGSASAVDLDSIENASEDDVEDDVEDVEDELSSPAFTIKTREDNGEFLPADIDEACDRGSLLKGPSDKDIDIVREVSMYEVQCFGSPKQVSYSHKDNVVNPVIKEDSSLILNGSGESEEREETSFSALAALPRSLEEEPDLRISWNSSWTQSPSTQTVERDGFIKHMSIRYRD